MLYQNQPINQNASWSLVLVDIFGHHGRCRCQNRDSNKVPHKGHSRGGIFYLTQQALSTPPEGAGAKTGIRTKCPTKGIPVGVLFI